MEKITHAPQEIGRPASIAYGSNPGGFYYIDIRQPHGKQIIATFDHITLESKISRHCRKIERAWIKEHIAYLKELYSKKRTDRG